MKVSGRMKVKSLKEEFKKEFGVSVRVYKGKQFADDDASLASIRAEGAPAKGDFEVRGNTKVGNVEKQFKDQLGITIQIENSSGELADNGVTLGSLKAGSTDKKKADKDNTPEKEKTVKPEKTKSEKLENIDFSSTLIALETKLKEAPDLIKYAEPLASQLAKYNLQNENAKVALVMDISGSMENSYKNGTVQEIINKIVPLSLQLNNNGTLDLWYYGNRYKKMNDVTLSNYRNAVPNDWESLMRSLGYTTDLASVMEDIINFFSPTSFLKFFYTSKPTYIIVITDGISNDNNKVSKLIRDSSKKPIFWQFVGVGRNKYGVLESLDTMSGRYIDNANFFALDDIRKVSEKELYGRLLKEFPSWINEARSKGIIK